MYDLLLTLHIAFGVLALIGAAIAMLYRKGTRKHAQGGKAFVFSMAGIFSTALLIGLINPRPFLALVAVFSFYMALTGWLRAKNRSGIPTRLEWSCTVAMLLGCLGMLVLGALQLMGGDKLGLVMFTFAIIGGSFAIGEIVSLRRQTYRGEYRIAAHLTRMLGGTIAVITAVAVVNIDLGPNNWIVWLTPNVILSSMIIYWNFRVRRKPNPA